MNIKDIEAHISKRRRQVRLAENLERNYQRLWQYSDQELRANNRGINFSSDCSIQTIEHWNPSLRLDPVFKMISEMYWQVDIWARRLTCNDLYQEGMIKEDLSRLGVKIATRRMEREDYEAILKGNSWTMTRAQIALEAAKEAYRRSFPNAVPEFSDYNTASRALAIKV